MRTQGITAPVHALRYTSQVSAPNYIKRRKGVRPCWCFRRLRRRHRLAARANSITHEIVRSGHGKALHPGQGSLLPVPVTYILDASKKEVLGR